MPTLSTTQAIVIGLVVALGLLVVIAYATRAPARRASGALAGGLAYGALNAAWDQLAFAAGWWNYPAWNRNPQLLPLLYILAGIASGAIGLIGWRAWRRFSWRGLTAFLLIWALWGLFHDTAGSAAFASSAFMVFSPGALPVLADITLYFTCGALAQAVMWLVAGPPTSDRLARGAQRVSQTGD